jgi:hypothetical protein
MNAEFSLSILFLYELILRKLYLYVQWLDINNVCIIFTMIRTIWTLIIYDNGMSNNIGTHVYNILYLQKKKN